ncbi:hypothetical protein DVK85_01425 [Flavobacterium arcticum]|uniref:ATPase AAA-type core domain-containing protein n=1 Tax=Flavobacterium arcticum TaxID=1784713 RepID=A0A345H8Q3_9FLAO|nr:AAA family ATPase [Flavobacterium arcticum]AXG72963.1 hypothetical protein DVK85_01425 [Flavobacterium arcticum]KAF2510373.1 AAA family ATPase [Flavobacterium arcticum]
MKLLTLKIKGYKNLLDETKVSFDFNSCTTYTALMGLNGTGKSNILEAVSLIFSSLYHDKKINFKYNISYKIDDKIVTVDNGKMSFTNEGSEAATDVPKKSHYNHLPTNVIASYSGEELRMWGDIYFDSYSSFFRDLKKHDFAAPKLLYINKYTWEFALIALLCLEDPIIENFIQNILKIDVENLRIEFTFDLKNINTYPTNQAIEFIQELVKTQSASNGSISIDKIQLSSYKTFTSTNIIKEMFYALFITGMPVKNVSAKIYTEKIITNTEIKFNDIDVKKLSEGEKKLILIYTITHLLADDKTLILLDEPDAHIHIERKKDIIDIIDKENCFTLFTTHSPKILNSIDENNIRLIKKSQDTGVEAIILDKVKALTELTNGEFSITDATLALSTAKDILLVEGENDLLYINEAIDRLNKLKRNKYANFNFLIINCGGAGNVPAIFREIVAPNLKPTQFCIATFDKDQSGKDGVSGIQKYLKKNPMTNVETMTHTTPQNWEENKEFFMEDYFPIDVYRNILLEDINKKTKIKDFIQLSKDTVKSIINNNYKKFNDADFENFESLLDTFIEKQTAFHSK